MNLAIGALLLQHRSIINFLVGAWSFTIVTITDSVVVHSALGYLRHSYFVVVFYC